ncbi:MAG: C25 family cysteine peptidase [bacterium]|nr:C25 family cysteine peptidase [bacterium]
MRYGCLVIVFLIALVSSLAFGRDWTPNDDVIIGIPTGNDVAVEYEVLGKGHLRLHFRNPVVQSELVTADGKEWTYFNIEGETRTWEVGKPLVPVIARSIRLPNLGNIEVNIVTGKYVEYTNVDVLPQQPYPEASSETSFRARDFTRNEVTYSTNDWYPGELAVVSEPAVLRDARICVLAVQPVQVNPVTRTVRVYESIDIETVPIGGVSVNELIHSPGPVPSFEGFYRDIIGAEDLALDARTAKPGQILVISRDETNVRTQVQQFVDWKNASGRPAQWHTFTTAQNLSASSLMTVIQSRYNDTTSANPLEYVILVGDDGATGAYALPANSSISDHGYTQLAGGDILGDITLGRLSCTSINELALQVSRTLKYERTPLMTDTTWYSRGWGYAGTSMGITSNEPAIRFCLDMMHRHGVTNTPFDTHGGHVSSATINSRLNPGAVLWAHRAGWTGEIGSGDVASINNPNKCFAAFNITCNSGDWAGGSTGTHEQLIRLGTAANPAGAIAGMASATAGTHVNFNNVVATGIYYGFGPLNMHQPGPMGWSGKFQCWRNYQVNQSSRVTDFNNYNNLMGDATALLWTSVPRYITANIPQTMGLGSNRLSLRVMLGANGVPDQLVTAWKKNTEGVTETYARGFTDETGNVLLTLTNRTPGDMFVTVIDDNVDGDKYPIIDTVAIVQNPADLALSQFVVDDDNSGGTIGNSNQNGNPGETIDLNIRLANRGASLTLTGLSATLTTTDPRIAISNSTQTYANIAPNDSAFGAGSFRVQLLAGLAHNEVVPLQLAVTAGDPTYSRVLTVPLTVQSIEVRYISSALYNAQGQVTTLTPGGSVNVGVTVRNVGGIAVNQTNATMFSLSPYISVNRSDVSYSALPIGTNSTNTSDQRFTISANVLTMAGTQASLGVAFGAGDLRDTVIFPITVGTRTTRDPTGPDAYGYLAYDNTDTGYIMHPTFEWVEIIPALGGSGTRLNINDGAEGGDQSIAYPLPFDVQFYGNTFDSATICTNGWLAFGVTRINNVLAYNNFRNWHLPANEGPPNIVSVFWDDMTTGGTNGGVYVYNDVTNHRLIVTWKLQTLFGGNAANECQLIIYDEAFYPSYTNDALLLFQYKTFNNTTGEDTDYCTIGISDSTRRVGLEYSYWNAYTPGSASIPNGSNVNRAILFTTAQNFITGTLTGNVTRADNGQPVENVDVFVLNGGYSGRTNAQGNYTISDVMIGEYDVRASYEGFNPAILHTEIFEDSTTTLNFVLTSPGFVYSPDSIHTELSPVGEDANYQIMIRNTGNGTLTWESQLLYGGLTTDQANRDDSPRGPVRESNEIDETDTPWDEVFSFNASTITGDMGLLGVEFDGQNFWVTGANTWQNPNKLYKFDRDGNLLTSYNQPDTLSIYGWRDLAWDGTYLYGSSDRNICQIDSLGHVVRTFATNVNPARSIAVDTANGLLYYSDRMSPIYAIRLSDGQHVAQLPNTGNIYGLAWYPSDIDGMRLYSFQRDANDNGAFVVKIDVVTGATQMVATVGNTGEKAAGIALTPRWNPMLWTMACVLSTDGGTDRVALYEVAFNTVWIQYSPESGEVAPGDSAAIGVHLSSRSMPLGTYRVAIRLTTNANLSTVTIPVTMVVVVNDVEEPPAVVSLPREFKLEPNYPNPFNPVTSLSFALPERSAVRLTIYNALGQEVARLLDNQPMAAGNHMIRFDATKLSAGVYWYRLVAGNYSATRKMVFLK